MIASSTTKKKKKKPKRVIDFSTPIEPTEGAYSLDVVVILTNTLVTFAFERRHANEHLRMRHVETPRTPMRKNTRSQKIWLIV